VFDGAGHCTLLERREELNEEMEAFLEEVFAG
jgi:pimeloyl-ACP methyl ester carboxylesterase